MRTSSRRRVTPVLSSWATSGSTYFRVVPGRVSDLGDGDAFGLVVKGAIAKAQELSAQIKNSWIPMQFDNPSNIAAHENYTAAEIVADFPNGIDYLITGVGTGGHISGVAKALKKKFPNVKVFAVEPQASPVISGGAPGPHPIQGIGAGFIPQNLEGGVPRRDYPS